MSTPFGAIEFTRFDPDKVVGTASPEAWQNTPTAATAMCVPAERPENWKGILAKETKNTLRDSVYSSLKAMIVTGQIPPGSRVTENDIAVKLNVSRTPVREAFNRLERDGLVTGRPRQGYVVTEFDINMFREAFDIRELLDGHATELAAVAATEQDKARLRAMLAECERLAAIPERTNREKFQELEVGIDLHRVIAEISGNVMLHNMLCGILDKCQHYVWTNGRSPVTSTPKSSTPSAPATMPEPAHWPAPMCGARATMCCACCRPSRTIGISSPRRLDTGGLPHRRCDRPFSFHLLSKLGMAA